MFATDMPPTGMRHTPRGRTARRALTTDGVIISAGNSFSASAPAVSAANASVGVATPGATIMPRAFAARMRRCITMRHDDQSSACRRDRCDIIRRHHGSCADQGAIAKRIRQRRDRTHRLRRIEWHLDDRMPSSTSAVPIGKASSGVIPRRIAINGHAAMASANVIRATCRSLRRLDVHGERILVDARLDRHLVLLHRPGGRHRDDRQARTILQAPSALAASSCPRRFSMSISIAASCSSLSISGFL